MNKTLLRSLFIVFSSTALILGGTIAYFSDTESTTGNTFAAGEVDLTVDSWAHYNGLQCVDGLWQDCTFSSSNLVTNGGFETPEVTDPAKWQVFSSIEGWSIEWVDEDADSYLGVDRPSPALQEYHELYPGWLPAEGDQYAELDSDWFGPSGTVSGEPSLVQIKQSVPTSAGTKYMLSYQFSPRPSTSAEENRLDVYIGNTKVGSHAAVGGTGTNWTKYTKVFIADGPTTIRFIPGGPNNSLGVFLDDIRIVGMDCVPSDEFTQSCESSWSLQDIGVTNRKLFNFQDIKPGDYGENTISLHVENNDAYACMVFSHMSDEDVTITEPESEVDTDIENGEMSENMHFFAWVDDGNNIWEEGEKPLFTETPEVLSGDTALDDKVYPLALPADGPVVSGDTRYIGIAWCAGEMVLNETEYEITCSGEPMGNVTQSDALSVDVSFYVEQTRHNGEFTCKGVLERFIEETED